MLYRLKIKDRDLNRLKETLTALRTTLGDRRGPQDLSDLPKDARDAVLQGLLTLLVETEDLVHSAKPEMGSSWE
jgi:hypothetical protein